MNNNELSKILQLIKNDTSARNHLFRKLETAGNPFPLLKPLKDEGYFQGEKNPEPIEDPEQKGFYSIPYWSVLGFLENVSKQNGKNPDGEITKALLEIIEGITNWRNPATGHRVENYRTDEYILRIIGRLPINSIEEKHIRLLDKFLRSKFGGKAIASEIRQMVLAKLIEHREKKLLLILLSIILDFEVDPRSRTGRFRPLMDIFWLREAMEKYKHEIGELCAVEAADVAIEKIDRILKEDKNEFSCIDIPSIEEHEQNWSADSYEFQLVFLVRDMLGWGEIEKIKPKVAELLKRDHSIFKRLGLYGVDQHYEDMKELFWTWKENPLCEIECERELYDLVENHCEEFSEKDIDKYIYWIEELTYEDNGDEKVLAYERKKWILPFKKKETYHDHESVNRLYEKFNTINPAEPEHPGWLIWSEESTGYENAFEQREFLEKTQEEQVRFLNDYTFKEGWRRPRPDDVAYKLEQVVSEQPERFAKEMMTFWGLKQDSDKLALLRGLKDAWNKEKIFEWEEIFNFCEKLLQDPDFWVKEYGEGEYDYRRASIRGICDLLIAGMHKDNHAFEARLLPRAENILLEIGQRTRTVNEEKKLTINAVINSTKYDVFSAIVNYAFRYARIYAKEQNSRWSDTIRGYFEVGLDKEKEPSLYYSVSMGMYLADLVVLDRDWVWRNINRILPKENEPHWKATFMGYLSMGKVYKDIYLLLRENGHYHKALQTEFESEHENEHVLQHICIGYLGGDEKLNDAGGLIHKLLEKDGADVIGGIIEFLHIPKKSEEKEFSEKIKQLWRQLYELLKLKKDVPEYANAIRGLYSWLDVIDKVDSDVVEWVKFSIENIKEIWNSFDIANHLMRHVDKTPEEVGDLYVYMLNKGFYPDYKKEDIQGIIEVLYEKQMRERADEICRLYQARGYEFLKEIYEKNRPR